MFVETKLLRSIGDLRSLAEQKLNTSDLNQQLVLDYLDATGRDRSPTDAELVALRQKVRRQFYPKLARAMAHFAAERRSTR